ncbi:hypothetical protein, partial [Proteus terrae]|uniref:hypothetical protein n=1 Tax=Proteus terrae TaxID=1574161 RepID=UPI00301C7007
SSAEPEPSCSTGAATDVDAGEKHILDLPGTSFSMKENVDSGKEIGKYKSKVVQILLYINMTNTL